MQVKRIILIGSSGKGALEYSYVKASQELGIETQIFDPSKEELKYVRGGKFGAKFHQFVPVNQWIRKMNRELVLATIKFSPELVLLFTNVRVLPGTLACIKTILPSVKIIWIWPDTPLNLEAHNILNAPLVDLTSTYSQATIPVYSKMNFPNIHWVPLAGDPYMHGLAMKEECFSKDISFVGAWRPERELIMDALCRHFSNYRIEIYGRYWKRDCKSQVVRNRVRGDGLYERQMAEFFNSSRININVIDDTNYPAANMRFFEVPTAQGLQLCSPCPEMEGTFRHQKEILYFKDREDAIMQVDWAFRNPEACAEIRSNAHALICRGHTYFHRLKYIIDNL